MRNVRSLERRKAMISVILHGRPGDPHVQLAYSLKSFVDEFSAKFSEPQGHSGPPTLKVDPVTHEVSSPPGRQARYLFDRLDGADYHYKLVETED